MTKAHRWTRMVAGMLIVACAALYQASAANAMGTWEPCDCGEAIGFEQWAQEEDCVYINEEPPPYYCASLSACARHDIGGGWWEYHIDWTCQDWGEEPCYYMLPGPWPWC